MIPKVLFDHVAFHHVFGVKDERTVFFGVGVVGRDSGYGLARFLYEAVERTTLSGRNRLNVSHKHARFDLLVHLAAINIRINLFDRNLRRVLRSYLCLSDFAHLVVGNTNVARKAVVDGYAADVGNVSLVHRLEVVFQVVHVPRKGRRYLPKRYTVVALIAVFYVFYPVSVSREFAL